jgi:hypothetical protein
VDDPTSIAGRLRCLQGIDLPGVLGIAEEDLATLRAAARRRLRLGHIEAARDLYAYLAFLRPADPGAWEGLAAAGRAVGLVRGAARAAGLAAELRRPLQTAGPTVPASGGSPCDAAVSARSAS